ncbi:MAG: thymidine phosphorylase family protein [Cytophagales bacterium]|nr:thymidine phosphorylase family protein [Cytophagales bacterium]
MFRNSLVFRRLGIDTQHEHFVYMREDCHICKSEGFEALTRIQVSDGRETITASLNIIRSEILLPGEISLSESALKILKVEDGQKLYPSHLHSINSFGHLRAKIYGNKLSEAQFHEIIKDIVAGKYSNIHLSAFITACAANNLTTEEISDLSKAMIKTGHVIDWHSENVVDKHCIGGLPGNRTTPIVISIVTSLGLRMPKTSSRAITSPAGTADTMEVITEVNLSADEIKRVVNKEGGCIVWGGTSQLSPADDLLIRVEKALDIDSEGQLIASVLSKKVAAGSSHVLIDIPIGETAKVRSKEAAIHLSSKMMEVGSILGLKTKVIITDGSQPVGRGIGPALEARDILAVLRNQEDAPKDLKERALKLAGELLELASVAAFGGGYQLAKKVLEEGKAYRKFKAICEAQGAFREPETAPYSKEIKALSPGTVQDIDNRKLAKIAKLAGAPSSPLAGLDFLAPIGSQIKRGQTLFTVYAESQGELEYALEYLDYHSNILTIN